MARSSLASNGSSQIARQPIQLGEQFPSSVELTRIFGWPQPAGSVAQHGAPTCPIAAISRCHYSHFAPTTIAPTTGCLSNLTGALIRPEGVRHHRAPAMLNPQAMVRQRRQNLVVGMAVVTGISLFLAFTTGSSAFVYLFTVSLLALCGYCYVLVQLRIKRENERYLRQFRRVA